MRQNLSFFVRQPLVPPPYQSLITSFIDDPLLGRGRGGADACQSPKGRTRGHLDGLAGCKARNSSHHCYCMQILSRAQVKVRCCALFSQLMLLQNMACLDTLFTFLDLKFKLKKFLLLCEVRFRESFWLGSTKSAR